MDPDSPKNAGFELPEALSEDNEDHDTSLDVLKETNPDDLITNAQFQDFLSGSEREFATRNYNPTRQIPSSARKCPTLALCQSLAHNPQADRSTPQAAR